MPQSDRVYRIASYLKSGQCLAPQALWREFATSPATIKRDIAHMRDRMQLPVVFDRARWGYRLDAEPEGTPGEPPRLLLTADELQALLTARQVLASVGAGPLLAAQRDRLVARLTHLLGLGTRGARDPDRWIGIDAAPPSMTAPSPWFETIGTALLQRKRLSIDAPGDDGATQTYEISPQRLVHREGHWQLDTWCHDHGSPLRWRIDAIVGARALDAPALDMGGGDADTVPGDLTPLNSHADPDLQ